MKKLFLVLGLVTVLLASCCNNNQGAKKCDGKHEQKCEVKAECQNHNHEACVKKCESQKPECCNEQQACEKQCEKKCDSVKPCCKYEQTCEQKCERAQACEKKCEAQKPECEHQHECHGHQHDDVK